MVLKDILGRDLNVGDTIVYAVSSGSSPYVNVAEILSIEPLPLDTYAYRPKVPYIVKVKRIATSSSWIGKNWRTGEKTSGEVTLRVLDRLVKLEAITDV